MGINKQRGTGKEVRKIVGNIFCGKRYYSRYVCQTHRSARGHFTALRLKARSAFCATLRFKHFASVLSEIVNSFSPRILLCFIVLFSGYMSCRCFLIHILLQSAFLIHGLYSLSVCNITFLLRLLLLPLFYLLFFLVLSLSFFSFASFAILVPTVRFVPQEIPK